MTRTSHDRRMIARAAALAAHAKWGSRHMTRNARNAWHTRFLKQVDPDHTLPAEERERRAEQAMRSHMIRMSRKATQARQKRAGTAAR